MSDVTPFVRDLLLAWVSSCDEAVVREIHDAACRRLHPESWDFRAMKTGCFNGKPCRVNQVTREDHGYAQIVTRIEIEVNR